MKLLLQYLSRHRWLLFAALLLAAASQVCMLLSPYILGHHLIDKYARHPGDWPPDAYFRGVLLGLAVIIGVTMLSRITKAFQDYVVSIVIQKTGAHIYTDGLRHALRLPYKDFEDQRSGETLAILEKVRTDCERFISSFINILFVTFVGIVYIAIYAFTLHPALPLVYIGGGFLVLLLTSTLGKKVKIIQRQIVRETNLLAGSTTESLRNIELVKSLGLTQQEISRINNTTFRILALEVSKIRRVRSISFIQGTLINLLQQGILFALLYFIFHNILTIGQLMTIQASSFVIFGPLQSMGSMLLTYRETEVSLNNLRALFARPPETVPAQVQTVGDIRKIQFTDVGFIHPTAVTPALENISFEAKKGETIAFAGPSGAGKTTLIKIIVGLYQPMKGTVCYNDVPGNEINFDELRQQIGFVAQDTQLFSGTIRENLLFVNPAATEAQLMEVLHQAACQSLLARAAKGIDTIIGEGGIKLSGGERQRLSIARALLRKPSLLLFDEATSALDSLTEHEIAQTIRQISAARAHITIIIAHRLSTIMHADRIYVLEKGNVAETGTHAQLLGEKGLYHAMWRMQTGSREN